MNVLKRVGKIIIRIRLLKKLFAIYLLSNIFEVYKYTFLNLMVNFKVNVNIRV